MTLSELVRERHLAEYDEQRDRLLAALPPLVYEHRRSIGRRSRRSPRLHRRTLSASARWTMSRCRPRLGVPRGRRSTAPPMPRAPGGWLPAGRAARCRVCGHHRSCDTPNADG